MLEPHRSPLGSLALIAIVIGAGAAAFAYTAGWFSSERLTPRRLLAALAPPTGPGDQHRNAGRTGLAQRHDRSPRLPGLDAARLLRAAARDGEQGPDCD